MQFVRYNLANRFLENGGTMKNLNLKLSKIFAFVTSVFLILALASCSELFSDPEKTGSVSFSLSPEVARAIPSRSLAGYSFDKDIDFSLDDDDPNTYIFAVSLSGDYSETQYKSYTEAEFTSLGNDSTITFSEIPVGSKVKASVTLSIQDSTGTYPWYEGTSDSKEIVEGTNSLDIKITKKQYACKFNVYIKGESDYELSSEYSKTLTGDLMAIDEELVESLESLYETLLQKGYILNEEKIDLWMPKLTGDSTLESSIYFDLSGSSEPGEDEPGEDEPGEEPTKTVTVGGITVTLAEFDTTDLGANFTMSEEEGADGSITLTATQDPVVAGYSYQWFIDGNPVDGATAVAYTWTAEMLNNLGTGVHDVTLMITFSAGGGAEPEHYSARTTFTVTAE